MSTQSDLTLFIDHLEKGACLAGRCLSSNESSLMAAHCRELMVWNKKINLTAIKDPLAMAEKHFIDAVGVSQFLGSQARIMDMGTGGGFPAIPLKVLYPEIRITMVDSVRKKVNFLNHVVRTLGLEDIEALHSRVEDLADHPLHGYGYDGVISRGFANLEKFVGLALPLLKPGGRIYALKGGQAAEEITPALEKTFHIVSNHYCLPFEKADRYLITLTEK